MWGEGAHAGGGEWGWGVPWEDEHFCSLPRPSLLGPQVWLNTTAICGILLWAEPLTPLSHLPWGHWRQGRGV